MKRAAVLSLITCMLLLSSPALADYDVKVMPENITVESGSVAEFQILILNHGNKDVSFGLNIIGPHLTWIEQPGGITVDAHGSAAASAKIRPIGENPGSYTYNVTVSALNYNIEDVVKGFRMNVINPVDIKAIFSSNNAEKLIVRVVLASIKRHHGNLLFSVMDEDGNAVKTESVPFTVYGEDSFAAEMGLKYVLAGNYTVVASIEGTGISASKAFSIEPVQDVQKTTDVEDSLLGREIIITVTNNGNVVENDYQVYEETYGVTGLVVKPAECDESGEKTMCASTIDRLDPGQTVSITYMIEYWPSYAGWAAGIVASLIVLFVGFSHATSPKISKKHVSTKGKLHTIALDIKNPYSRKHLNNVIIRDWVSPLARVVTDDSGSLKPITRRTEAGTELIWKLGDFRGKEERVISYKLKSMVEGQLKMPRAYLRYRDETGKGSKVFSKGVVIS